MLDDRRKKKCIRFLEDGGVNSAGEEDEEGNSVDTVHSTTEGDSELGSPTSVTHLDENRNQHPEISQSGQSSPPGQRSSPGQRSPLMSKKSMVAPPVDIDVVGPYNHHNMMSTYQPLPPLHRPIPLRDGRPHHKLLPDGRPHHVLASETVSCPTPGISTPSPSVSSSTLVLAT